MRVFEEGQPVRVIGNSGALMHYAPDGAVGHIVARSPYFPERWRVVFPENVEPTKATARRDADGRLFQNINGADLEPYVVGEDREEGWDD